MLGLRSLISRRVEVRRGQEHINCPLQYPILQGHAVILGHLTT